MPTTRKVLDAASAGDENAWAEIVQSYGRLLWFTIHRSGVSGASAGDVYQVVWLRFIEHIDRIRDERCVGGWLVTTARHECGRVLRGARRVEPTNTFPDLSDRSASPEEICVRHSLDQLVRNAVRRLPERDRRLLEALMDDSGPSYQRIARDLRMPVGSIGPTRARALARLRAELAELGVTEYAQVA